MGSTMNEEITLPSRFDRLTHFHQKKAVVLLLLLTLVTVLFALQLNKLKFSYDFNSFFPQGDPDLAFYEEITEEFGEYNNFLFILPKSENALSEESLKNLDEVTNSILDWPEVVRIESALTQRRYQITPFGINPIPLLPHTENITRGELSSKGLLGTFFGTDLKSSLLLLHHEAFATKELADEFYLKLEKHLNQQAGSFEISGKAQMQYDFTQSLEGELFRLLALALVILIIILLALFRSLKGVLIPILVLAVSLIWTMGLVALMGKPLDVMMVIVPAILLIISLSDVIHFTQKYDRLLNDGIDNLSAIKLTLLSIGKANFLTSITTAIGFLSLLVLPIKPIQDFGIYTAAGVLFAFIITVILIPCVLALASGSLRKKTDVRQWDNFTGKIFLIVIRKPKTVVLTTLVLSMIIFSGTGLIQLNTSIIVGMQRGEDVLNKVTYFDEHYGGYKPFELAVRSKDNDDLFDSKSLEIINDLEQFLVDSLQVSNILSPLSIIKSINSGLYGGSSQYYKIPEPEDLRRVKRNYQSPRLRAQRETLENDNGSIYRILGRTKDLGSKESRVIYNRLQDYFDSIDNPNLEVKMTGASYLIDKTDYYVSNALLKGILIAIVAVAICMFLFFKNPRIAIMTIIPNLFPVLGLMGVMGFLGIDLNITTAIVFTVALGIAVDDSIHLVTRWQEEIKRSRNSVFALRKSLKGTGKSIILTSLISFCGFSVFLSSGLSAPFYLGLFIVIVVILALLYDLFLLPLLLLRFTRRN